MPKSVGEIRLAYAELWHLLNEIEMDTEGFNRSIVLEQGTPQEFVTIGNFATRLRLRAQELDEVGLNLYDAVYGGEN